MLPHTLNRNSTCRIKFNMKKKMKILKYEIHTSYTNYFVDCPSRQTFKMFIYVATQKGHTKLVR